MDEKEQALAEIRKKLKECIVTGLSLEGVKPEEIKDDTVLFGEGLRIGELEFSVVKLREPCFKFNARMKYKGAAKAMLQSGFSGWYLRVNQTGQLAAGAAIIVSPGAREISIAGQNQNFLGRRNQQDLWE